MRSLLLLTLLATGLAAQAPVDPDLSALLKGFNLRGQPGGVLAASIDGELAHLEAFGLLATPQGRPIATDSRFYIASTAKMFTAACLHLLAASGDLDLGDPLSKHIPELGKAAKGITLRHMLHHRSGLRDFYEIGLFLGWDLYEPPARGQIVELLARQQGLNFEPGRDASYSNSNYLLLAMVVERASGQSFAEFAREKLFLPLGMVDTAFGIPAESEIQNVASGHTTEGGRFVARQVRNRLQGAGGAWSTAEDLLRWSQVFSDPKWEQLRDAMLSTPELGSEDWLSLSLGDYRTGLMYEEWNGLEIYHHAGGYLGSQAQFLYVPELELCVALVVNRGDIRASNLAFSAAEILGLEPNETGTNEAASETPADGRWILRGEDSNQIALLRIRDGKGVFQSLSHDLRLTGRDRDSLTARGGKFPITVGVSEAGIIELQSPGKEPRVFAALSTAAFQTDDLQDLVGEYSSAELGGNIELYEESGKLALRDTELSIKLPAFHPLSRDHYVSSGQLMVMLEFERDEDGSVLGLRLGTGRAQGILFDRL